MLYRDKLLESSDDAADPRDIDCIWIKLAVEKNATQNKGQGNQEDYQLSPGSSL